MLADMDEMMAANRRMWDERAPAHAASPGYCVARLVDDPQYISDTVAFDLPRLGRLDGLDVVHLQCHIGTDTVSLARLGARSVTGLDLSPASLVAAASVAQRCGIELRLVEGDVYAAAELLGETYDLVYTGIGAINWLPDIRGWAQVVADVLRPGGRLFIRDAHPMMNTLAQARPDGLLVVEYPYGGHAEPLYFNESGTYVETDVVLVETESYEWNHRLSDIVQAVIDAGLTVRQLVDHDSVPWEFLDGQMEQIGGGEWRIADRPERVPHSFTLQAVKA
jgi:SAM-dependent methyltransferase